MSEQLRAEVIEEWRAAMPDREMLGCLGDLVAYMLRLHDERERLRNLQSKDVTREHVETIESEIGYRLDPYDIASSVRVIVASLDKPADSA